MDNIDNFEKGITHIKASVQGNISAIEILLDFVNKESQLTTTEIEVTLDVLNSLSGAISKISELQMLINHRKLIEG